MTLVIGMILGSTFSNWYGTSEFKFVRIVFLVVCVLIVVHIVRFDTETLFTKSEPQVGLSYHMLNVEYGPIRGDSFF